MAVYLIADIRVINAQRYDEYRAVVRGAIRAQGGRYLARTDQIQVLEGNWVPPRIVVIEFPDMAATKAFRKSPAYQKARDICANAAMVDMVLIEGVDPAPPTLPAGTQAYYVISDIRVINEERFEEYRRNAQQAVEKMGARFLARDGAVEVLEGGWQPARLSIVEYPSRAAIDERLQSEEFNRTRELRTNAAMVDSLMITGWPFGTDF